MSMVVEVGEVESSDCLREPHPRGKGLETLMQQEPRHQFKLEQTPAVDQQGKECKGSHITGLIEVVSCFRNPRQEHRQSVFYFNGETNSAMGYVIISFVLLWYCFRICSHVIVFCFR
jgi:hypothetical protein